MTHDVNALAPGELALVHEFVNTLDVEAGTDALDAASSRESLTSYGC